MPKIMKLCLDLLKLCRKNCGLFFSGHGVSILLFTIRFIAVNNGKSNKVNQSVGDNYVIM